MTRWMGVDTPKHYFKLELDEKSYVKKNVKHHKHLKGLHRLDVIALSIRLGWRVTEWVDGVD